MAEPTAADREKAREIEIAAAEVVDKFNRAQWSLNDDCDGIDDDGCNMLRELVASALAAVRAETVEEIVRLREALYQCETVMMIVEPRSHKAEYLATLRQAKVALAEVEQAGKERR